MVDHCFVVVGVVKRFTADSLTVDRRENFE